MKRIASAILLVILLTSMLCSAFKIMPAEAAETIYIRADGSMDPPTAPIQRNGNVYTFTDNIFSSIVIQRSNLVVDGKGHTLQGNGSGYGFYWFDMYNVTVKNTNVKLFHWGFLVDSSRNNVICGNNITANNLGLDLDSSFNNTVSGNCITDNGHSIYLIYSSGNTISENNMTNNDSLFLAYSPGNTVSENNIKNNRYGVYLLSSSSNLFFHNSFTSNDQQVYPPSGSTCVWDDGYPSGGNYWSDYTVKYPGAEELGSSGIWDTPYVIDAYNQDNYPLINPWIPTSDSWPMFRHDPTHTGHSTSQAPNTNQTLWNYTIKPISHSSPAVANGKVFIGTAGDPYGYNGGVYAFDESTGALLWSRGMGCVVLSSPAVADGRVFIGIQDYCICALNESTGDLLWYYTTSGMVYSSPAVADGKVFVGSYGDSGNPGFVYALNESTGACIWSYSVGWPSGVRSSPAVASGRVFVGASANFLALNESTGSLIWSYTNVYMGSVSSSPAVADGKVFIVSGDGKAYAFDESTGAKIWDVTIDSQCYTSSPAVADGKVFIGSYSGGKVYALDESTGAIVWSYTTSGFVESSPAVADGKVFIGSWDNKVYALDESTGALIWSYATGGAVSSSPAVADGKVFIGSGDGKVYAFGASGSPPTPPTVADSFRFPLDGDWAVSRRFGKWYDDFQGYHLGEDVLRDSEAPVYAPANGVVKWNENVSQYGYVLVIEHELADGSFVCSVLGHLREEGRVTVDSTVTKGQLIGYLSSLPEENGGLIHVHFGIRKGIYSEELDFDGKWRYRGYGPVAIADYWHPPSQFIDYYNIQKTQTLPEEEGLRVTITSDKTFYQLNETINFNVTVTNPTNETGINIIAHNSSLIIEPPAEIELENPQTFHDLGDINPGESKTLSFTAIAKKAGALLKTWARAAGEDLQLGLSMIGAYLKQLSIGDTNPTEWSFAVITDLHIGRSGCSEEVEGRLQQAVSAINALRTDGANITFVLVPGDITDAGGVNDFYEAQRILNRLNDPNQDGDTSEGIPYIPIIGNHDVKSNMEWCFNFVFWSAGNGNNWNNRHLIDERLMGFERQDPGESYYQNYYFSYDGLDFLCLDVAGTVRDLEDSPATQYPEQTRQFVKHYFDMNHWESFVIASHFPLYEWGGFWGQDALEQDITSYGCDVTNLAGHTHRNYETWWSDRFRVIETEAVCQVEYSVPKDFPEPGVTGDTIRIVNVKNGEIDDYSILKNPETVLEEHRIFWEHIAFLTVEGFGSYIQPNKPAVFKANCPIYHGFETSFQWAFGDGDYGSGITVSHSYLQEGDYNVTVNITKRNLFTNETTTTTIVRSLCVRTKHIISALPPESFATSFPLPVDLTETPTNMYCQALIGENDTEGEKPVVIIGLHFENASSDIDLSNLLIDTDTATRKSIVFSVSWPAEADCDKWLFVPSSGTGSVYICLNATALNDVKLESADFVVNDGETVNNITVASVNYEGKEYYLVYGNLTGLGAGERALVPGDLNLDWTVDIFDIVIVALEFGHPPPPIVDPRADVNKDGLVDIFDIVVVALHFGETG